MNEAIVATVTAMSEVEEIVRATYGDTDEMARRLVRYARTSTPAHSLAWVVKKAHDALNQIEWEKEHVALNRAVGMADDYVG